MQRVDVDNLIDWVRYAKCDEAVTVSAGLLRDIAKELKAARRVIGYASVSKLYLTQENYGDIVRELSAYESLFYNEEDGL